MPDLLIYLFIFSIVAFITMLLAKRRGRDPIFWFFLGFLFGVFAIAALLLLPYFFPQEDNKSEKEESDPTSEPEPEENPHYIHDWFHLDNKKKIIGPYSYRKLQKLWLDNEIELSTYVWNETMANWNKINEIENLKEFLEE